MDSSVLLWASDPGSGNATCMSPGKERAQPACQIARDENQWSGKGLAQIAGAGSLANCKTQDVTFLQNTVAMGEG